MDQNQPPVSSPYTVGADPVAPAKKGVPFSWILWLALLVVAAITGSLSSVNSDGIPNFGASVKHAFAIGDGWLIVAAVCSVVALLWLVVAAVTGSLSQKK